MKRNPKRNSTGKKKGAGRSKAKKNKKAMLPAIAANSVASSTGKDSGFSRLKSVVKNMTPEQRAAMKAKFAERRRTKMSADQQIATAPVSDLRPNY